MENREKELLESLKQKTENIQVPENLLPQELEKQLAGKQQIKSKKFNYYRLTGIVAACITLMIGGAVIKRALDYNIPKIEGENMTAGSGGSLKSPETYSEVYDYLQNARKEAEKIYTKTEILTDESISSAPTASASQASTDMGGGYSDTNVREEGVGESDYVKTDGKYLYLRKDDLQTIVIVDTQGAEMEPIGMIQVEEDTEIREFYVKDKKLLVLCRRASNREKSVQDDIDPGFFMQDTTDTLLLTYDISNPKAPLIVGEVAQSGSYYSSRIVEDYIYVFSQFYASIGETRDDISAYIPQVGGEWVRESQILLPSMPRGEKYMVISSVHIENPKEVVDSKAVFSQYATCYVGKENIYVYEYQNKWQWGDKWKEDVYGTTNIQKIGYKNGKLEAKAQNTIYGYIESSFSIDEYNEYLRTVVTVETDNEISNAVYVMDPNMEIVGKIEGLAEEERVYSARFMGDTAYFVTFRETDPLFSVDFSDPINPRIVGALKIPGFSEYLHPYNDHLLLGIGMDIEAETGVTGGVKISMFDISDPMEVKEIDKFVLTGVYGAEVFYDYKAVLIEEARDIIGISTDADRGQKYYVLGYQEGAGFLVKLETDINGMSYNTARGIYMEDTLYIVKGNIIEAYSLEDYRKVDDLIL